MVFIIGCKKAGKRRSFLSFHALFSSFISGNKYISFVGQPVCPPLDNSLSSFLYWNILVNGHRPSRKQPFPPSRLASHLWLESLISSACFRFILGFIMKTKSRSNIRQKSTIEYYLLGLMVPFGSFQKGIELISRAFDPNHSWKVFDVGSRTQENDDTDSFAAPQLPYSSLRRENVTQAEGVRRVMGRV